jgi:hypothetical protein
MVIPRKPSARLSQHLKLIAGHRLLRFSILKEPPHAPAEWQNRFWTGMMFTAFGELENVKIITDRYTGQSKGFGYVEMPSNSEADGAIKALNGKFINGRNIKVNPSDPGGKRSKHSRRSVSRNGY